MKRIQHFFFSILFLVTTALGHQDVAAQKTEKKETRNWYESYKWLNGLQLKPHKTVNIQQFAKQYKTHQQWWDKAFAYLKETDLSNLKAGKYPIDGENVFAIVTEGATKDIAATKWEAHHNYQDIHYVIKGKEQIGIAPVSSAKLIEEYDREKDIAFYSSKGKFYKSSPGTFFIIFPEDAHRPGIKTEGYNEIKKIVIKVRKG